MSFHETSEEDTFFKCYTISLHLRKLSLLMLCMHVFIFTSGSSALSLIWLSLLAIFNTLFRVYTKFFSQENRQNTKTLEVIFVWYENGRQQLLGVQSINTERASLMWSHSRASRGWWLSFLTCNRISHWNSQWDSLIAKCFVIESLESVTEA